MSAPRQPGNEKRFRRALVEIAQLDVWGAGPKAIRIAREALDQSVSPTEGPSWWRDVTTCNEGAP